MANNKGGDQLRERREELGKTQRELAEMLGIASTEISDYENGLRRPGLKRALEMEKKIGLPAEVWT